MGSSYYTNPLIFLVDIIFSIYIMMIMLRTVLQWARADFYNPLSQLLVTVTDPALKPLQRIIPASSRIDTAAVVLMLLLQMFSLFLIGNLRGSGVGPFALLIVSFAELISLLLNVFLFSILIQVVLSWINPGAHNPATSLIYSITEPVLMPARKMLPPMSGLDLSATTAMVSCSDPSA
ncbi:MAG TPA: YggT family protein [Chromatiales bacterium]|nr:YggT family protein [Chromatiales bacterium]